MTRSAFPFPDRPVERSLPLQCRRYFRVTAHTEFLFRGRKQPLGLGRMPGVTGKTAVRFIQRSMREFGRGHFLADFIMTRYAEFAGVSLEQVACRRTVRIVTRRTASFLDRMMDNSRIPEFLHHLCMASQAEAGHFVTQQPLEIRLVRVMACSAGSIRHRWMDMLLLEHFCIMAFGTELRLALVRVDQKLAVRSVRIVTGRAGTGINRRMDRFFRRERLMAGEAERRLLFDKRHARLRPQRVIAGLLVAVPAAHFNHRLVGQFYPLQWAVAGDAAILQDEGLGNAGR